MNVRSDSTVDGERPNFAANGGERRASKESAEGTGRRKNIKRRNVCIFLHKGQFLNELLSHPKYDRFNVVIEINNKSS